MMRDQPTLASYPGLIEKFGRPGYEATCTHVHGIILNGNIVSTTCANSRGGLTFVNQGLIDARECYRILYYIRHRVYFSCFGHRAPAFLTHFFSLDFYVKRQ